MNKFSLIKTFFLQLLIFQSFEKLKVTNLQQLGESDQVKAIRNQQEQSLKYEILNYGHVPYGTIIYGSLFIASPHDACSPLNLDSLEFQEKSSYSNIFILVKAGNCGILKIMENAQSIGSKIILLSGFTKYDSLDFQNNKLIPALGISSSLGQQLEDLSIQSRANKSMVRMSINFALEKRPQVAMNIYLQNDQTDISLLEDIQQEIYRLENKVIVQPVYNIFKCSNCEPKNCLEENTDYCTIAPYSPGRTGIQDGQFYIKEYLRSLCIIQYYNYKIWFQYIQKMQSSCTAPFYYEECSLKEVYPQLGINQEIVKQCAQFIRKSNGILEKNQKLMESKLVYKWPTIFLNNREYSGSLNAQDIIEMSCSMLQEQTQSCIDLINKYQPLDNDGHDVRDTEREIEKNVAQQTSISTGSLIAIILSISCFLMVITFYFYKRHIRKQMHQQMQVQVENAVQQYIQFKDNQLE